MAQRLIVAVATTAMLCGVVPAAAEPDLWIWRDRWNIMGSAFQNGYITGVFDAVVQLALLGNSPAVLSWAHKGVGDRFPTIRSAVEWTDAGVAKAADPLQMIADMITTRLLRHANGFDEDDIQASPASLRVGFMWKDRWVRDYSDVLVGRFFCDGFVSGVFDTIRSLDNQGKSPTVLMTDIDRAAGMSKRLEARTHKKNPTLDNILQVIRPVISLSQDPTENMAIAIFEAMRRY